MRKKKIIFILIAAVMVLTAMPAMGLAADEVKDWLKLKVTTGTSQFQFEPYINKDSFRSYDVYIEQGNIKDRKVDISFTNTDWDRIQLVAKGQLFDLSKDTVKSNTGVFSFEVNILPSFNEGNKLDDNITIKGFKKTNTGNVADETYLIKLFCVVPVTAEVGENGKVTVGTSIMSLNNDQKSCRVLTHESPYEQRYRIFDVNESVIFFIQPDKGYWPIVEGARIKKYSATDSVLKAHTAFVKDGIVHDKDNKVIRDTTYTEYDKLTSAEKEGWYVLPDLKLAEVHNIKITFVPLSDRVTTIANESNQVEYPAEGGKIKVSAKGDEIAANEDITLALFLDGKEVEGTAKKAKKNATVEFTVPKNDTLKTVEYTVKASLDDKKTWSKATLSFKVLGAAKKSNAVTSIKASPEVLPYGETDVIISVAGEDLADQKYILDIFAGETRVLSQNMTGPASILIVMDRNDTGKDITYTVRASLDNREAYSDASATFVMKAKEDDAPEIADIYGVTANPSRLDFNGGQSTITVDGPNLANKTIEIAVFEGDVQTNIPKVTLNTGGNVTTPITFPANATNADKVYTVKAKDAAASAWSGNTATVTVKAKPAKLDGWVKNSDGKDVYYQNGVLQTKRWLKDADKWYYLDKDGLKETGWFEDVDGKWYFLETDGVMQTGWVKVGNFWYLLHASSGKMLVGWQKVGDDWFLMAQSGRMLTGWQNDGGDWYLLDTSGRMLTGWQQVKGKWYYMDSTGRMKTGWLLDKDGKWYYLNHPNGDMVIGIKTIGSRRSSFNSKGAWLGYV